MGKKQEVITVSKSIIRIYQYTFENPMDMTSIKLMKNAQYNLIKR